MKGINERLQEMTNKLYSQDLLNSQGLGNEINFHVFDYDPEDEYIVRDYVNNYLATRPNLSITIIDIYDVIIEILKEDGFFDSCFEYERTEGTKELNDLISRIVGIGTNNNILNQKIKEKVKEGEIVILIGVGKCYEIVRAHTILNNLHVVLTNNPVIMLYPGSYNGQSFKMFNKLDNDNYYRAFQLVDRK